MQPRIDRRPRLIPPARKGASSLRPPPRQAVRFACRHWADSNSGKPRKGRQARELGFIDDFVADQDVRYTAPGERLGFHNLLHIMAYRSALALRVRDDRRLVRLC